MDTFVIYPGRKIRHVYGAVCGEVTPKNTVIRNHQPR